MAPVLRDAMREDAPALARLVDIATDGLLPHLWGRLAAPGEDGMAYGVRRLAGDTGGHCWRNGVVAEIGGAHAGGLLTYRVTEPYPPLRDVPPMLRPAQALKDRWAIGTQYVLALAVLPEFRRRGVARALMAEAERRAAGASGVSLTVLDGNLPARALYAGLGFVERDRAPLIKEDWDSDSQAWLLLVKPIPKVAPTAGG